MLKTRSQLVATLSLLLTFFNLLELLDFKTRRVAAFKKNLIELTELEIKHAKVSDFFTSDVVHAVNIHKRRIASDDLDCDISRS